MQKAFAVPAVVLLAACATHGRKIDPTLANQLVPGVATPEDAIRMFGKPSATRTGTNNVTVLVWMYGHANGFTGNSESACFSLVFKDGKLASKTISGSDFH